MGIAKILITSEEVTPNKYGKYFLAWEAPGDDPTIDGPVVNDQSGELSPPAEDIPPAAPEAVPPVEEVPAPPKRNLKVIEIKPRNYDRFQIPEEEEFIDGDMMGGEIPPNPDMGMDMSTGPNVGMDIGMEVPPPVDTTPVDVPPVDTTQPPMNTTPPPMDTTTPDMAVPTPAPEVAPPIDTTGGMGMATTPVDTGMGTTPPMGDMTTPPAETGVPTPPQVDMSTPLTDTTTPPAGDMTAPTPDAGGEPDIDDTPANFDAGMDDGTDTTQQPMNNAANGAGPGLEYDSTRKYILFKNYMSLSNAIENYISKLEAKMGTNDQETIIYKNATDKLREVGDLCYDYLTMKFEISTYIQSLLFFQNLVVMIQATFDFIERSKKKLKNRKPQK